MDGIELIDLPVPDSFFGCFGTKIMHKGETFLPLATVAVHEKDLHTMKSYAQRKEWHKDCGYYAKYKKNKWNWFLLMKKLGD